MGGQVEGVENAIGIFSLIKMWMRLPGRNAQMIDFIQLRGRGI